MTQLVLPLLNQTGKNEWADVESNLIAVREVINGELEDENLSGSAGITDANLASPNNSAYREVRAGSGAYPGSTAGTNYFDTGTALGTAQLSNGIVLFYFAEADRKVASKTQKLRIRAQQATGAVGPGTTLTVGMYPVTAITAGTFTVGTVVSGSTVAFASTAANTLAQANSSDFAIPADGYYIFGVANSGTTAASSQHDLYFQLQVRSV